MNREVGPLDLWVILWLMIGEKVAQYRILDRLGQGAMGIVFLAEDELLGRKAVLKFLGETQGESTDARTRLMREARAASALEHPNVCGIFGIDETEGGRLFLAMPYYAGETLAARLSRGPVEVAWALEVLSQAAEGLAKAHRHGIVHRDVKPANLLITTEGQVKILDFGLAKDLDEKSMTGEVLLGTPIYLAPERLMHEDVAPAVDQWSLAVIAFEMLVGQPPIRADQGTAKFLRALASTNPRSPSQLRSDLPAALDAVFSRALAKDPEERYADVRDFTDALRGTYGLAVDRAADGGSGLQPDLAEGSSVSPLPVTSGKSHGAAWIPRNLGALALLILVLGVFWWAQRPPSRWVLSTTTPLTRDVGLEKSPALSPDGRWLAYASDQNGNLDIWVRQLESGASAPLTADHPGYDDHPTFSPDGRWIAFVSDRSGGGIFLAPAAGGPPKLLLRHTLFASHDSKLRAPTLAFSPDGKLLAVAGTNAAIGIVFLPLEGGELAGEPTELPLPDLPGVLSVTQPSFSPDGQRLAFAALSGSATTASSLWIIGVDGSAPTAISDGRKLDFQPVFADDGNSVYFISDRGGTKDIWSMSLDRDAVSAVEPLTVGVGVGSFALDARRSRLIYSKLEERSNVWRMPFLDRPARLADARPLTDENHLIEIVDISPDGRYLAFDSDRGGNVDIWLMNLGSGALRRLTDHPAHDWCPRFSPDGKQMAFYSLRAGSRDVFVMDLEEADSASADSLPSAPVPLALTATAHRDWMPTWSADGATVFFDSDRSGSRGVWSVPSSGGDATPWSADLTGDFFYPVPSPGGDLVVATQQLGELMDIVLIPLTGGPPKQLTRERWVSLFAFDWSSDGRYIYANGRRSPDQAAAFWQVDVETGEATRLSDFRSASFEPMDTLAIFEDGLIFPLWELRGDLWMAELEQR